MPSETLAAARALLQPPPPTDHAWPALLAALAFAVCALGFAFAAVTAPPVTTSPIAADRAP